AARQDDSGPATMATSLVRCGGGSPAGYFRARRRDPPRRVRAPRIVILVDTGPLVAAALHGDVNHVRCAEFFTAAHLNAEQLLAPSLVVTEVCYLLARESGPKPEAEFIRSLAAATSSSPNRSHPISTARPTSSSPTPTSLLMQSTPPSSPSPNVS